MFSLKIEIKSLNVDESFFHPAINASINIEYRVNQEAPINLTGNLYFQEKLIGMLEPKLTPSQEFYIGPTDYNRKFDSKNLEIQLACVLDNKIVSYMNEVRKSSQKGDVELRIELTLTYLLNKAMVSYIYEIITTEPTFPRDLIPSVEKKFGTDNFSSVSILLYAYPRVGGYQPNRTNLNLISSTGLGPNDGYLSIKTEQKNIPYTIKSSDWVHDFLPKLGIGEYEIIEVPKLEETDEIKDILGDLDTARNKLYNDLDIGASLTSLRNSLKIFLEFVKNRGGFEKLFDDNNNIIELDKNLQERLYGATSRSEESTSSHKGGAKVEGYEAESMIFMAYSLYKMVFDKIKSNETRGAE